MEENTFQFMDYDNYHPQGGYESASSIERWLFPGLTELGELDRENYLMDKTNAFNEYMFDKTNTYNSPIAQMERMKEAGINPMLAAAGIAGNGSGAATPIPSQGANVGMNTNVESPFDILTKAGNTIDTITGTADKLGKLIGFGKENKLNFEIAKETAKKLKSETGLNWHNYKRLESTFEDFCREMTANADKAEQEFKNLQKLWDKYNEETELLKKQQELTDEQTETQKEITLNERHKRWENEFKKQFREMFGVQLNDSDASMFAQLMLNGHGEDLINAISKMFQSLAEGIKNNLPKLPQLPKLFGNRTPRQYNGLKGKEKEISERQWDKLFIKEQRRYWNAHPKVREYWNKRGGFEAYVRMKKEVRLSQ